MNGNDIRNFHGFFIFSSSSSSLFSCVSFIYVIILLVSRLLIITLFDILGSQFFECTFLITKWWCSWWRSYCHWWCLYCPGKLWCGGAETTKSSTCVGVGGVTHCDGMRIILNIWFINHDVPAFKNRFPFIIDKIWFKNFTTNSGEQKTSYFRRFNSSCCSTSSIMFRWRFIQLKFFRFRSIDACFSSGCVTND